MAILIETFEFSLGDDEIEWHMNDIVIPVLKGSDNIQPSLPMHISVAL